MELLRLAAGAFELVLCPAIGGSIARFTAWGIDMLRPASGEDLAAGDPRRLAAFPLVPFSNRVADARFPFQGRDYRLARNFPPEPHAIHGNGWQRAWRVESSGPDRAVLALAHDPARDGAGEWPFAYEATQSFRLDADGLAVELALRNTDTRPMPAGIGLHPFFPGADEARLTARLAGVWRNDARKLPVELTGLPPEWDFAAGRDVAGVAVDNCFTGWDGRARLDWPSYRLLLEADPAFANLVVFVPPGLGFFCLEPVTNVNDAVNLAARGVPGTGLAVLAPGATLSGTIRLLPTR